MFYISPDELLVQVMTLEDDGAEEPLPNNAVLLLSCAALVERPETNKRKTTSDIIALIFEIIKGHQDRFGVNFPF